MTHRFDGVILAGGASRRMGEDKAFIDFHDRPLIAVGLDALTDAESRTVVGGDRAAVERLGVRWSPDLVPGGGPFNGLLTALRFGEADHVVVLPCDLMNVDVSAVSSLLDALGDAHASVPLRHGRAQWIPSAWRRDALPLLESAWDGGVRSLRAAIRPLRVVHVVHGDPHRWDDADTKAELDAADTENGDRAG